MSALETLAERALGGDRGALGELCRALETPLFRLAFRILGDVRDAEDATQEILVKVVTHLAQFEGKSALSTWAHAIAVRHVLASRRSRAEERAVDEGAFAELLEAGLAYGAKSAPPTPEDRALRTEIRLGCTQAMLLILGREERLALVLVDLLGFDASEAAAICECAHDALRQRLARSRARLSAFLVERCGEANPAAACHCERQIPAKSALSTKRRLTPLVAGDLPPADETHLAVDELRAVRAIAGAFHREGALASPASLRARVEAMLPTVFPADGRSPTGQGGRT